MPCGRSGKGATRQAASRAAVAASQGAVQRAPTGLLGTGNNGGRSPNINPDISQQPVTETTGAGRAVHMRRSAGGGHATQGTAEWGQCSGCPGNDSGLAWDWGRSSRLIAAYISISWF